MSMLMFPKCFLAELEGNLNLVNTDIVSFKSGSGSSMFIYMFSKQLYKKSAFIILSGSKFFKPKHYFSSFFIHGKENII